MNDLDEFLKTSKARLQVILDQYQWTEENIFREYNTNSYATVNAIKSDLLDVDAELTLPPSCADSNSVVLGDDELRQLLNTPKAKAAQKFSDLQVNFNREEKLLLYEHTVKKEVAESLAPLHNELVTLADIVAMKKREKTKRRKYRISKPTQTEEVRSLVELQMQALQQYLETKQKMESNEKKFKRENKNTEYTPSRTKNQTYLKDREEKAHTSNRSFQKRHENEKVDTKKYKTSEIVSRESRHREHSKDKSQRYAYRERRKSRSRSRSRHRWRRNRSRSSSRHRSRHHSRKSKKEKHMESHRKSRHDSRS